MPRHAVIDELQSMFARIKGPIPAPEEQMKIYRRVSKLPPKHPQMKYMRSKGGPFSTHKCKACKSDVLIAMFTPNNKSKLGIPAKCSPCYISARRGKHTGIITTKEARSIRLEFSKCKLPEDFNDHAMIVKINRAINRGLVRTILAIRAVGFIGKIRCICCKEDKYANSFKSCGQTPSGLSVKCSRCLTQQEDVVRSKARGMKTRTGVSDGAEFERNFREAVITQGGKDYYTMVPFSKDRFSPWTSSPERLVRSLSYEKGNVVATAAVLNVGGTRNWSHAFTVSTYEPMKHPVIKSSASEDMSFIRKLVRGCERRARNRASKSEKRRDESGVCDIDENDIVDLLKTQRRRCSLSKLPLAMESNHEFTASVDRIDPTKGYTRKNIRLVVLRFNGAITWTKEMYRHYMKHVKANIKTIRNLC